MVQTDSEMAVEGKTSNKAKKPLQFCDKNEFEAYRKNERWQCLSNIDKEKVAFLMSALKKSYVIKVCKDKFTIKRRIPFLLNAQIQSQLDSCTVKVRGLKTNFEKEEDKEKWIKKLVGEMKLRFYRISEHGLTLELTTPENAKTIAEKIRSGKALPKEKSLTVTFGDEKTQTEDKTMKEVEETFLEILMTPKVVTVERKQISELLK